MADFAYTLIRQPRRKTLCITVSGNNEIIVKASKCLSRKYIDNFIERKSRWITKTLHFNRRVKKSYIPKKFVNGEKLLYLGKEYPLILKNDTKGNVSFKDGQFSASIPAKCKNHKNYITKKLILWYKIATYKEFIERISSYERILGVSVRGLKIKTLKKSWANCSKKGVVSFAWNLIMAPVNVIDYVIIHELCHLIHPNHSQDFWRKVKTIIPNYKLCKKWLIINAETIRL